MLGTGNGNFATPIVVAAIASPSDVITADFNGDTKPDLATNGYNVSVVINCNNANIEGFSNNNEIKIYPNPANNSLQVTIGNEHVTDVKIYDLLGKQIKIEELKRINDALQIDVSNLKEGVYFVDVKTSTEVLTKKLIIQR